MCRLAIVILNWNGSAMMRRYLPSVLRCSDQPDVSVVVADNGSTDDSLAMLAAEFPQVRTIAMPENYGFAEGYNQALRQIEAEYYMLLNSDVEIRQDDWLAPMLDYMDAHPGVAACQPKLLKLYADGAQPADSADGFDRFEYAGAAGGFIDRYGYPYCRGRIMQTVEADEGQYDTVCDVMWTTGAAMLVRSEAYWQAGGLDGQFFAHMEEIDLCWRLRIMGYRLVCIPQSTAYHLGGATLNQGNPRKTFLNFRNNLLMLYKCLPDDRLVSVLRMRHFLDFVAAMQFLLKGDKENMKAVFRAKREYESLREQYATIRQQIQDSRRTNAMPDIQPLSILWQYYFRGRRRYNQL